MAAVQHGSNTRKHSMVATQTWQQNIIGHRQQHKGQEGKYDFTLIKTVDGNVVSVIEIC
jgi:hypothetical protein